MKFTLALFAIFVACEVFSQPIEMYRTLGGAHFQRDTIYLSHKQVAMILAQDPAAAHEFKVARKDYRIGGLMGFGGAILLAIPVITAIGGGEPEWALAGGGAVLLGASIPFNAGFKRHSQAALEGFNSRQGFDQTPKARLYFTGNGFRLKF